MQIDVEKRNCFMSTAMHLYQKARLRKKKKKDIVQNKQSA